MVAETRIRTRALSKRPGANEYPTMVTQRARVGQAHTSEWRANASEEGFGRPERGMDREAADGCRRGRGNLNAKEGANPGEHGMSGGRDGVEVGRMARQDGGPPAGADAAGSGQVRKVAATDEQSESKSAGPAQAEFHGIAALHAGFANIGGKGGPAAVVVDQLRRRRRRP